LITIKEELKVESSREYWEVTERGANFTFIEKSLIDQIDTFFSKFSFAKKANDEFWDTFWASASSFYPYTNYIFRWC
jgi:hypothetical protein